LNYHALIIAIHDFLSNYRELHHKVTQIHGIFLFPANPVEFNKGFPNRVHGIGVELAIIFQVLGKIIPGSEVSEFNGLIVKLPHLHDRYA